MAIAKHLDGFVRRKVIKQTVMTTVYGVTRFGARLQIAKQLKGNFFNIILLYKLCFYFLYSFVRYSFIS